MNRRAIFKPSLTGRRKFLTISNTTDFEPWLLFFLRSLKKQKDRLAEKIGRDPASEGLHPDALKILEAARRTGRITTGEAETLTGAPRPTVKTRLAELVRRGLLKRHGQGRGAWYELSLRLVLWASISGWKDVLRPIFDAHR
jgi:predicted HTH transcriptional regulator